MRRAWPTRLDAPMCWPELGRDEDPVSNATHKQSWRNSAPDPVSRGTNPQPVLCASPGSASLIERYLCAMRQFIWLVLNVRFREGRWDATIS